MRGGAGSGFPSGSAVSAALRAQSTGGLFPAPLDLVSVHCGKGQFVRCVHVSLLVAGKGGLFFFLNRAEMLTHSQLSLASCLQNLFMKYMFMLSDSL